MANKTKINKTQLIIDLMTQALNKASKESLIVMLKRPNSVRVAKIANFTVSGTMLKDVFTTQELYDITNAVYFHAEDLLAPSSNDIQNDALLAQLKA